MTDIASLTQRICDLGAAGLNRYADISNTHPFESPEYFMSSYIFSNLAKEGYTITLETSFSKLHDWNNEARTQRLKLPPRSAEEEVELLKISEAIGQQKVDMVIFEPKTEVQSRDDLDLFALIEFKKGVMSESDKTKLTKILPFIDTCRYGIVCGVIHVNNIQKFKTSVEPQHWHEKPVDERYADGNPYVVCAYFIRGSAIR